MRTVRQEDLDKAASQTRLVLIRVTTMTVLKKIYQPLSKITVNHVYLASRALHEIVIQPQYINQR